MTNSSENLYKRQLDAIEQLTSALHAVIDPSGMKALALDTVLTLLGVEAGSILYHDESRRTLVFDVVRGPASAVLQGTELDARGASIVGRVFRTGGAVIVNDPDSDAEHDQKIDKSTGFTSRSLLTAPLRQRDGPTFGVIQLLNKQAEPFNEDDIAVLEMVGNLLSMAIENARLARETQLAAVARSLGELSHDIGNMLSGILPYVDTLGIFVEEAKARPTEEALGELGSFYDETRAATAESVDRIQSLAREVASAVKGEVAPLEFAPGSPLAAAREVARALAETARLRGVALEVAGDETLEVCFDRRRLYNALYNLANNALAETSAGGMVGIAVEEAQGCHYSVEVRDTGRGMPEEVRSRLFTDSAVSTKPGGTGLGTRIVRRIVEQHGGTVAVESELGQGTTVRMLLPKEPASAL